MHFVSKVHFAISMATKKSMGLESSDSEELSEEELSSQADAEDVAVELEELHDELQGDNKNEEIEISTN